MNRVHKIKSVASGDVIELWRCEFKLPIMKEQLVINSAAIALGEE